VFSSPVTPSRPSYLGTAAVYLLAGEGLLALMAAMVKWQSDHLPITTLIFGRCLFGFLTVLPLVLLSGVSLKTQVFRWHFVRAFIGMMGMAGYFYVLGRISLPEATLVKLTSPFFLPIVAWFWLKESIETLTVLAIIVGFIGITLILQPGTDNFAPAALIGILAAFFASCAKVTIRFMSVSEPSIRIVFYFALLTTMASAVPLLLNFTKIGMASWAWLAVLGALGTGGQILMTQAYRLASPGYVGVFTYASVIYASVMGWLIWGESLNLLAWFGAGLVVLAGVMNLFLQSR